MENGQKSFESVSKMLKKEVQRFEVSMIMHDCIMECVVIT